MTTFTSNGLEGVSLMLITTTCDESQTCMNIVITWSWKGSGGLAYSGFWLVISHQTHSVFSSIISGSHCSVITKTICLFKWSLSSIVGFEAESPGGHWACFSNFIKTSVIVLSQSKLEFKFFTLQKSALNQTLQKYYCII